MQSNINSVFGKAKRRREAIDDQAKHLFSNPTARNTQQPQPAKSRLFSILKEADINKNKTQKPSQPSKPFGATKPRATPNDPAQMQGHNFAHRAAGRPNTTTPTSRTSTQQNAAPSEQQTRGPDVRRFKSANRLTGLFSSVAERSVEAEAAWKASKSARKVAATRIQQEKIQEQADRAAKLVEERERLAKELAEKQAAIHQEELLKREKQRAAAWQAQNKQFRKAAADRNAGFVPDRMWPRENWQGVVFGNDYTAFKQSQRLKAANLGLSHQEILEQAFDYVPRKSTESTRDPRFPNAFKRPSATASRNAAPPPPKKARGQQQQQQQQRQRDFDEENPDDCWGYNNNNNNGGYVSPPTTSAGQQAYRWAESPPFEFPSGYGSPYSSPSYGGEDGEHEHDPYNLRNDGPYGYHDGGFEYEEEVDEEEEEEDDYWGGAFFQGEEWENFKRSWHGHSRDHHHDYYYTNFGTDGYHDNGASGRGGGSNAGAGAGAGASTSRGQAGVAVCKESALRAAQRAIQAAASNATTNTATTGQGSNETTPPAGGEIRQEDINARMQEIESAILSAAQHSGNEIAAFAAALNLHVDHSKGQEHAKKMAKKGLLMTFHPDKLARAGVLEQFLGQCITQLILTSVK